MLIETNATGSFGPADFSRYATASTDLSCATIVHEVGREEHEIESEAVTT